MFQPVLLCLLAAGPASAQVAGGYVPPAEKPSESGKSGEPLQIDFAAIKIRFQPPAPPYPPLAKIAGIQGTVVVDLTVDESGSPARARAIEGPPQLRACAEAYAMRWLFQPYFAGGKAIPVHFRLVMPFRLRDAPPAETRPRIGRAVFELKMLPSDLSVSLDRESLQAEARKVLTDGGITLVDVSGADPKTTHHLWLGIQPFRMADGSYGCTVMQRCSLLSDLLITNNAPGQPPRVWSSQQLLAQQSLEGFPENIAKAALRTLRSTVAPPLMMVSVDPSKVAVAGSSPVGEKNGGPSAKKVVDFDFAQLKVRRQPPAPAYPTLAKLMGIQGVVVVELVIDPAGKPVRAEAIAGPSELQAAAVGYALQWEFEPAKLNGVPQTAKFRLTMPFNLRTDPPPPAAPPRP